GFAGFVVAPYGFVAVAPYGYCCVARTRASARAFAFAFAFAWSFACRLRMSVGLSAPRFSGLVVPSGVAPTGWGRVSTDAVAGYFGRCAATLLSARPP